MEILFLLLVFVLFYFILLKPVLDGQRRKKRDLLELSPGDRVLTAGGLLATVKRIELQEDGPSEIVLDLGNNVEVRALAQGIEQRLTTKAPAAEATIEPVKEQPH
jgi:preprotein translocase subunit YajC